MNYEYLNEDNEYVFVDISNDMDCESLDEDSFDLCDDEELSLSQSPSAGASVCSEAMFEALNANAISLVEAAAIAFESESREPDSKRESEPETESDGPLAKSEESVALLPEETIELKVLVPQLQVLENAVKAPSQTKLPHGKATGASSGSRLSNKKRRKQIKKQKKAAAAAAAAEALASKQRHPPSSSSLANKSTSSPKRKGTITNVGIGANVAVLCAHQSLAEYRKELSVKTSARGVGPGRSILSVV